MVWSSRSLCSSWVLCLDSYKWLWKSEFSFFATASATGFGTLCFKFSVVSRRSLYSLVSFWSISSIKTSRLSFSVSNLCSDSVKRFCTRWSDSNWALWEVSIEIKCITNWMIFSLSFYFSALSSALFFEVFQSTLSHSLSSSSVSEGDLSLRFFGVFLRTDGGLLSS